MFSDRILKILFVNAVLVRPLLLDLGKVGLIALSIFLKSIILLRMTYKFKDHSSAVAILKVSKPKNKREPAMWGQHSQEGLAKFSHLMAGEARRCYISTLFLQ